MLIFDVPIDYSPSGRLTQTWPTGDDQLVLCAFGYGLSYTTFDYRGASASSSQMDPDGSVQVHVKVKNRGKRASDEVVQMYVQHLGSAVTRPQLELKGFKRVRIEPGAEKDVAMELKARDLAYWDTPGTRGAWRRRRCAYWRVDRVTNCRCRLWST